MYFVTFEKKGRTGNTLFQYLMTKLISIEYDHKYVPIEEIDDRNNVIVITDDNISDLLTSKIDITHKDIICDGYFQNSDYYIGKRDKILKLIYDGDDYWINCYGDKQFLHEFINTKHNFNFEDNDIVLSVRLDDFIEMSSPSSDIISPNYYINILEHWSQPINKLYIISDKIKYDWERAYLQFFEKWNPIFIQGDLLHDCAVFRDCPNLLHSNSTLCWFMSFISKSKRKRYIPKTHFYKQQSLNKIEETDVLTETIPLSHKEVFNLVDIFRSNIYPFSYCIPDDCIVDDFVLRIKTKEIASLIPGQLNTYIFNDSQEKEYHQMYRSALFGYSMKKGGWDCLRHYEILANGCIPLIKDINDCPTSCMVTFPKQLIQEAIKNLLPWNYDNKAIYDDYVKQLLKHTKQHCSSSANVRYLLEQMKINPQNILLITGHYGVNYTRETFWIGMKRYIQSIDGVAVEFPKIEFLYDNYIGDKKSLHGNGFTYSCKLKDDYSFTKEEIIDKINSKFFDLIIYGKVGPDEGVEGSLPNMPLWNYVVNSYNRNQIACLYGGDEAINLTRDNKYRQHILYHCQFAHCFVRELII